MEITLNTIEFAYYSDLNGLPIKMDCTYTPLYMNEINIVDGDRVAVKTIEVNHTDALHNIVEFIAQEHLDDLRSMAHIYFKENFELTVTAKMKA